MKRILMLCLIIIYQTFCYGQIKVAETMDEVFSYISQTEIDKKTLAIFDVDMVLVQPSDPAFQMANMKRYGPICKRFMKEVPTDKQMLFLSLMTLNSAPMLIDARTPLFLKQLMKQGVSTMALTSNLTGSVGEVPNIEQWRIKSLNVLGIDFSQNAPYRSTIIFDNLASYRGNSSIYREGILFVNGNAVSKGDAFLSFVEKTGILPNKIIFIDDREDNLKSVESAIQTLDWPIEYLGIHFLGAQKYPSPDITEKEFEAKWSQLVSETMLLN